MIVFSSSFLHILQVLSQLTIKSSKIKSFNLLPTWFFLTSSILQQPPITFWTPQLTLIYNSFPFLFYSSEPLREMLVLLKLYPLEPHESYLSDLCLRFLSYMFKKVIIVILQMPPTYAFYLFSM